MTADNRYPLRIDEWPQAGDQRVLDALNEVEDEPATTVTRWADVVVIAGCALLLIAFVVITMSLTESHALHAAAAGRGR